MPLPLNLAGMPAHVVILPLLFSLGVYLVLMGQPLGRPRPDLKARLRRLNVPTLVIDRLPRPGDAWRRRPGWQRSREGVARLADSLM